MTDTKTDSAPAAVGVQNDLVVPVRKWVTHIEDVLADGRRPTERPIRRAVIAAVITNPYAGEWVDELEILETAGGQLAAAFMTRALELLDGRVEAYGKAGVVGERGEIEHVAALLHPQFGEPTRKMAGGVSILPSAKKHGGPGTTVDVPIHHKKAMRIRSHFGSIEFRVPDAPAADEIVVALGVSDGSRPHPRVGGLTEQDAKGVDGLV